MAVGYWNPPIGEDSEVACEISREGHHDLLVMSVMGQYRREESCTLHFGGP